jgi:hypothetical protein
MAVRAHFVWKRRYVIIMSVPRRRENVIAESIYLFVALLLLLLLFIYIF